MGLLPDAIVYLKREKPMLFLEDVRRLVPGTASSPVIQSGGSVLPYEIAKP